MSQDIVFGLPPSGTLRAGINLAKTLLVTGSTPAGEPTGVAPDMAHEIADRLGMAVCGAHHYLAGYPSPVDKK